jgi:hypothetical protein
MDQVEAKLYGIITSALDRGKTSASHFGRFTSKESMVPMRYEDSRARLNAMG